MKKIDDKLTHVEKCKQTDESHEGNTRVSYAILVCLLQENYLKISS